MNDQPVVDGPTLQSIHRHLVMALEQMDALSPDSIFGCRLQQLIDEVEAQIEGDTPTAIADSA